MVNNGTLQFRNTILPIKADTTRGMGDRVIVHEELVTRFEPYDQLDAKAQLYHCVRAHLLHNP